MNPITLTVDSVRLTLVSVEPNKLLRGVPPDTFSECYGCTHKPKLSLQPMKTNFIATEAIFNVRNVSCTPWLIPDPRHWEMVDTDGFAYHVYNHCKPLQPPRLMVPGEWRVTSGTQVNFALLFPEMEPPKEISSILLLPEGGVHVFQIAEMKPDAKELLVERRQVDVGHLIQKDLALQELHKQIDRLESAIQSRLNDGLIPKEATSLENSIRRTSFEVEQKLRVLSESKRTIFEGRLSGVMTRYSTGLEKIHQEERQAKALNQRVEKLCDLTAREFEEYVESLFKELGYEKVTLTPASNDKGIDLLMRHKGLIVATQCKKYRGTVGSPDIQTFLGAMKHAGAHKGFFITTGTFSFEAEKMASEHPIELVDSVSLASLIEQALKT